jgi:hypothetical protein
MTESAAEVSDLSQSVSLGSIARLSIFVVALVVGIEQLGINIQFITTFIIVIVGVKGSLINITSTMLRLKLMKGECLFPRASVWQTKRK